jgi:hypothetical protein
MGVLYRRDVRITRGGQGIVRVTLLVSLRDDSIRRGKDSPCLMIIIVYYYSGSGPYFIPVFILSFLYMPKLLHVKALLSRYHGRG